MTVLARVAGVGMACPVGLRSRLAVCAMDAGVMSFVEREDVLASDGAAGVSMLEDPMLPALGRTERAAFFATHAVRESLESIGDVLNQPLPTVFVLPSPGVGPRIDASVLMHRLATVPTVTGSSARLQLHHVVEQGRAGVFEAIDFSRTLLAGGHAPLVLVAAVDSLVDTDTLRGLVGRNRLTSRTNGDGTIPGEAAACILFGHPQAVPLGQTLALLSANAVGREPVPLGSSETLMSAAQGLTAVFRKLRIESGVRVDEVFEGTSGELFFSREFAYAYLRNEGLMPEPLRRRATSASLGDVGAAAGAVSLVNAVIRVGPRGPGNRRPSRSCLAYGSSDLGLVGGCVVTATH